MRDIILREMARHEPLPGLRIDLDHIARPKRRRVRTYHDAALHTRLRFRLRGDPGSRRTVDPTRAHSGHATHQELSA